MDYSNCMLYKCEKCVFVTNIANYLKEHMDYTIEKLQAEMQYTWLCFLET